MRQSAKWNTKHGMCRKYKYTKLYGQWSAMKRRCNNKNNRMYAIYGGRGITYCDEWDQFIPFMEWALANGHRDGLALDRIDGDGNYCPENCRWVTQAENNRNRRNLIYLEASGERKLLVDWARETGQPKARLYHRYKSGWTDAEVIYGRA